MMGTIESIDMLIGKLEVGWTVCFDRDEAAAWKLSVFIIYSEQWQGV